METSADASDRHYAVTVDGGPPTECDERTLMIAWALVPDLALIVRGLDLREEVTLFETPRILVRRLR